MRGSFVARKPGRVIEMNRDIKVTRVTRVINVTRANKNGTGKKQDQQRWDNM